MWQNPNVLALQIYGRLRVGNDLQSTHLIAQIYENIDLTYRPNHPHLEPYEDTVMTIGTPSSKVSNVLLLETSNKIVVSYQNNEMYLRHDDKEYFFCNFPSSNEMIQGVTGENILLFSGSKCLLVKDQGKSFNLDCEMRILSAAFSRDETLLALGFEDGEFCIGSEHKGFSPENCHYSNGRVIEIAFSNNNEKIICKTSLGQIEIWDLARKKCQYVFKCRQSRYTQLHNTIRGNRIAYVDSDAIVVSDIETGETLFTHDKIIESVDEIALSKNGKNLVVYSSIGYLSVYVLGEENWIFSSHVQGSSVFRYDIHKNRVFLGDTTGLISIWDLTNRERTHQFRAHESSLVDAQFSSDGVSLLTYSRDNTARLWDISRPIKSKYIDGRMETRPLVTKVAVNNSSELAITYGYNDCIQIWNCNDGISIKKIENELFENSFAFWDDQSNNIFLVSENPLRVKLVTLNGNKIGKEKPYPGPDAENILNYSIDFCSGKLVFCTKNYQIKVWDFRDANSVTVMKGQPFYANSIRFDKKAKMVVGTSDGRIARVWNAVTGQVIIDIVGHEAEVDDAIFHPSKNIIATMAFDRTVGIWNLENGDALIKLIGHRDYVHCGAFSPCGKKIVTGSRDRTAIIWEVETGDKCEEIYFDQAFYDVIWEEDKIIFGLYNQHLTIFSEQ